MVISSPAAVLGVAFVSVPVAALVSSSLVSASQVPLAVSASSCFPYRTVELSTHLILETIYVAWQVDRENP